VIEQRKTPLALPALVCALFLGLYLAWLLWARPAAPERMWTGGLTLVFTGLCVAALAWKLRDSLPAGRERSTWTWAAAAFSLWAAADVLRMLFEVLIPGRAGAINPTDILFLLGSAVLAGGFLLHPRHTHRQMGRLRLLIEATITTAVVLSLAWMIIFRPVSLLASSALGSSLAILYPISDLLLLLVLLNLFLINETRALPGSFFGMLTGLVVYTAADLAYAALLPQGGYSAGSLVNFGWVLGDAVFAAAIYTRLRAPAIPSGPPRNSFFYRTLQRVQSLLPLVLTIVLGWYTILDWQVSGAFDPLGLWATVLFGLALIGRQGLMAGEYEFQQYARLVDSVAEPTFICSLNGDLRLVNPALLAATGADRAGDLLNHPLQQIISPARDVPRMLELGQAGGWSGEVLLRRGAGAPIPVMLSLRPLVWGGREKMTLAGTAHDLSESKHQQADLQHAYEQIASAHDELERLNTLLEQRVAEKTANLSEAYTQLERQNLALQNLDRLKSDFVSLVSHELRAPLTNINGGIELVLARVRALPATDRETLAIVQAEILRLTRFIETILDLSALDSGRVPVYPAPLDLNSVVGAIQRQMLHLPGASRIRWELPDALPELLADERALVSVLFHLLDNALKYAPEGAITVSAGSEGTLGWVRVADQGKGIPEEDMPLLFTRFFRSRPSDAQTVYGHGLGLYIVQRLLEALNGKIEAQNRPEGGASFTCWLPLAAEEDAGEENEPEDISG
jgi:PAS domain S-box-containing protein